MTFNIHKQTDSEEDKKILCSLLIRQEMRASKHDFNMFCGCCMKEVSIAFACKCFYCGIWFCWKCSREHFKEEEK